jgi:GAF domain-containing protein
MMLREALRITGIIAAGESGDVGTEVAEAAALVGQGDLAALVVAGSEDAQDVVVVGAAGTIAQAWFRQPLEDLRQLASVVIGDGRLRVGPELEHGSNGHSPITSVLGVSLPSLTESGGALLVGRVRGAPPLNAADVARLEEFAGHLDAAWARDRAREDRTAQRLVQDHFRVTAEVNEHIIARLFSLALELVSVRRALSTNDASPRLLDAVAELDATITWLRNSVVEPAMRGDRARQTSRNESLG